MNTFVPAIVLGVVIGWLPVQSLAEEPNAEKIELKDNSTLYLHPDGTGRMVDQHGKHMDMSDGVPMEATDGRVIMMKNKKVWIQYGPPGKGGKLQKPD